MSARVSVIVPVYNCERYLTEALASIAAQTQQPDEIVVVDDGSTDRSAEIAQSFSGVTLIRQANAGVGAARNAGLAAARGEIITWLDADDYWLPGKLAFELRYLAENPLTPMTICHQLAFVTPGDPEPKWLANPKTQHWLTWSLYAMAMRREVFRTVGVFDPALRTGEDIEWVLRARDKGVNWDILDHVLVHHRVRPDSLFGNIDRGMQGVVHAAGLAIRRRRAAAAEAQAHAAETPPTT